MSLTCKPIYSKRPLYTAAYVLVGGELRPKKPKWCLFSLDSKTLCHVSIKGRRRRKIGLKHPLFVYGCSDHAGFFTVYPLGWAHFGRRPLVELAPDGSDFDSDSGLDDDDDEEDEEASGSASDLWQDTAFGASIDADGGRQWPLTSLELIKVIELTELTEAKEPKPYGVFRTQQRHIAGVLHLFRLDSESDNRAREGVAAKLPVSLSLLNNSASKIRDGPADDNWQRDGIVSTTITQKLMPPRRWLKHLLELGAAINFWGSPMYG